MTDEYETHVYDVSRPSAYKKRTAEVEALRRALGRVVHGARRALASRFKKLEDYPTRVDGRIVPDQYDIGYSTALQEIDPLLREAFDDARREIDGHGLGWASEEELLPPLTIQVRKREEGDPCCKCGVPLLQHPEKTEDGHYWDPRYHDVPSRWNDMPVGTWVRQADNIVGEVVKRTRFGADGIQDRASVTVKWLLPRKQTEEREYRVGEGTLEQFVVLPGKPVKGRMSENVV